MDEGTEKEKGEERQVKSRVKRRKAAGELISQESRRMMMEMSNEGEKIAMLWEGRRLRMV